MQSPYRFLSQFAKNIGNFSLLLCFCQILSCSWFTGHLLISIFEFIRQLCKFCRCNLVERTYAFDKTQLSFCKVIKANI